MRDLLWPGLHLGREASNQSRCKSVSGGKTHRCPVSLSWDLLLLFPAPAEALCSGPLELLEGLYPPPPAPSALFGLHSPVFLFPVPSVSSPRS